MSAGHWFRLYDEVLDDPKVQRLSDRLFRLWISVLCATSRNKGMLPSVADLAFMLRRGEGKLREELNELMEAKLLEQQNGVVAPHNWDGRQFKSDHSTDRVKRFRERFRNGDDGVAGNGGGNGGAALHETPPETETYSDTEQNQNRQKENNPKSLKERNRSRNVSGNVSPNGKAGRDYLWIVNDDARWPLYAKAYADAHDGKQPPRIAGLGGMGWHFAPLEVKP